MKESDIEKLIVKLDQLSFTSFEIKDGDFKLKLKKEQPELNQNSQIDKKTYDNQNDDNSIVVKAPFVGIVYLAPSKDKNPYVYENDFVKKGDTLLLIEAMKMFNEVKAPQNGEVVKILVKNGEMVEFNQPLLKIINQ